MNKLVWNAERIVRNNVDEDCITSKLTFNEDGTIVAEVEHHIYLRGKTYTGFATIHLKAGEV